MSVLLLFLVGAGVQGPFFSKTNPQSYADSHLLLLQTDTVDTREPSGLSGFSTRRFVIKFAHPPDAGDRAFAEASGLKLEGYLPRYAYLVSGDISDVQRLLDSKAISWASPYEPLWKIAPRLCESDGYSDTIHIWLFNDASAKAVAERLERDFHATVYSTHDGMNKTILAFFEYENLLSIAALDDVRWIEPFYAPSFQNDQAQWVLQSWQENVRSVWARGLQGRGVITSTGDAGITTTHVAFRDSNIVISDWGDFPTHRKIIAYKPSAAGAVFGDMPAVYYHGTHTAGTVCGNDSYWGKSEPYDGMAPEAKLYFVDVGSTQGIAYPDDYNDMYLMPWQGNEGGKAKFMSNSWGSGGTTNSYDLSCRQTDEFMWNHPDFLILFSAGNSTPPGIITPATAKNVVTVGATLNGESASIPAGFSSTGPTQDGRTKPTITAPGYLVSAYGGSNEGYLSLEGTSMSCPATAGACALLVQYLREGWYPSGTPGFNVKDSIEPSAALLKAMLITSTIADFPSYTIPDFKIGWGRVCIDSVLYFQSEGDKVDGEKELCVYDHSVGLQTDDEAIYTVDVTGQAWPLRVTLVWTDYPGDPAASKQLVNDLDLEATSPSGKIYKGNVFTNNFSTTGGTKDAVNVEECLRISSPETGTWSIKIRAANTPQGPQPYALVITGMFSAGQPELVLRGFRINDSASVEPNQALDPAESAMLYPRLYNAGDAIAENVEVTISTTDSLLTITDDYSSYGSIEPGKLAEGEGFPVELSTLAEPDTKIKMQALVSIANKAYLDIFDFYVIVGRCDVDESRACKKPEIVCPGIVSGKTCLSLTLHASERVKVELFDASGRKAGSILNSRLAEGSYSLPLDIKGRGVYFVSMSAGDYREVSKIIVLGE